MSTESIDEEGFGEDLAQPVHAPEPHAPRRTLESGLLMLVGFAAAGGGVAMLNAKHFSWTLFRVSRDLDRLGISKGSLIMGGLILIGIGMAIRAAAAAGRVAATSASARGGPVPAPTPVAHDAGTQAELENLQAGVGLLQGELERTQAELTQLASCQQEVLAHVAVLVENAKQGADEVKKGQNDALFGLAASMDKIGQRLEQTMQTGLQPLREALERLPDTLEEHLASVAAAAPAPAARPASTLVQDEDDEEMTVLVELEDDGGDEGLDAISEELGLLDELDRAGRGGGSRSREAGGGLPALDFDKLDLGAAEAPPAALPKQQAPQPPTERPAPSSYGDLDSLLPDERVDEAVDRRRRES